MRTFRCIAARSTSVRFDAVMSDAIRGSFRFVNDNEDNVSNNQFAPGIGYVNNAVPGRITTGSSTQVLGSSIVNEVMVGRALEQLRVPIGRRRIRVRLPRLVAVDARRRSAAPRAIRQRTAKTPGSATTRRTSIPYVPLMGFSRRKPRWTARQQRFPSRYGAGVGAAGGEPEPAVVVPGRPVVDARAGTT